MKRRSFDHDDSALPARQGVAYRSGFEENAAVIARRIEVQQPIGTLEEISIWHSAFFWSKS